MSVLIVDDYRDGCVMLARLLRAYGHRAECAFGGEEAMIHMGRNTPSAVILDLAMPKVNGLDILRSMRRDARLQDVPVIIFSSISDEEVRREAIATGAQDYFVKGRDPAGQLAQRLHELLRDHAASAEPVDACTAAAAMR